MPRNKDLKRLVRSRMTKTGESYTAARAQLILKTPASKALAAAPTADFAALAGMTDDAVKAKTGCDWQRWVKSLDHHGAAEMSHREIAQLISTKYKVGPWWTQMVAVGYERIKGLRARGQQRDGSYQATKSKTFNADIETLFDAWHDAAARRRWLDTTGLRLRGATRPKSIRLSWPDGGNITVGFLAKGPSKTVVAVEHVGLPDRETAARTKEFWGERLGALAKSLE